jgi:hypothetical protein
MKSLARPVIPQPFERGGVSRKSALLVISVAQENSTDFDRHNPSRSPKAIKLRLKSDVFQLSKQCVEVRSILCVRVDSIFCYLVFSTKVSAILISNRQ